MNEQFMLKFGEIVLKGQNRRRFEEKLLENIKRLLYVCGGAKVFISQSTVFVTPNDENADNDEIQSRLQKVFGIVAVVRARKASLEFSDIEAQTADFLGAKLRAAKTFKVEAKRADKTYPLNSPQIAARLGEYLLNTFPNLTVDVHSPELTVRAEIRDGAAYIHDDPVKGAGGLPSGTSGHGLLMLSGGIDSPVAGYKMAKRGMKISAIHFESPPYTSEKARAKVEKLARKLSVYSGGIELHVIGFTEIQEAIRDKCREDLFTVIMRRFMLRIACRVAEKCGARAIITGESLGQVASQTTEAIFCTDKASDIPVFRPLIGDDKQEIIDIAYKIDTFFVSVEPYEDCCTVFTPKHPKTSPRLNDLLEEESKLDIEGLLGRAGEEVVSL